MKILVTGAKGFIGQHLMKALQRMGHQVTGWDITYGSDVPNHRCIDLRIPWDEVLISGVDQIYHLAADMGGIGYITKVQADVMIHNMRMTSYLLDVVRSQASPPRVLFTSSACVYPAISDGTEASAYPANPDSAYGWEKLFAERMLLACRDDHIMEVRIARLHNIYGPGGTFDGGREKSIAALCRKVVQNVPGVVDTLTVWGTGAQTRTYCYIDDCVRLLIALMNSDYSEPLNIGSDRHYTLQHVAELIVDISGKKMSIEYDPTKPVGVEHRTSENTLIRAILNDEPCTPLRDGLVLTYAWIKEQMNV